MPREKYSICPGLALEHFCAGTVPRKGIGEREKTVRGKKGKGGPFGPANLDPSSFSLASFAHLHISTPVTPAFLSVNITLGQL